MRSKISVLVATSILFGYLALSCEKVGSKEDQPQELPNIVLERFWRTETKNGRKMWILSARRAKVYDEVIYADSVQIRFFDDNEKEFSLLTAPGGIMNIKSRDILVGDSVTVLTNDSTKLFTDSLFWQNDSQKIMTDGYVKILKKNGSVIEGKGLRTDPYLRKIEIISETKGLAPIELPKINR